MKMFFSILLATAFIFVGTACTKGQLCDTGKTVSTLLASQIATSLSCSNQSAIDSDIQGKLVDLKICAAPISSVKAQLSVGQSLCQPIVDALVGGLLNQIPSTWGCTGGKVTDDLKTKLLAQCQKVF